MQWYDPWGPFRRYNINAIILPSESSKNKSSRAGMHGKNSFSKITDSNNVVSNKSRTDRAN